MNPTSPLANFLLAQQATQDALQDKAGLMSFLSSLDEDVLAPVMILGTIFFFVTCIVSVITIFGTYHKVTTAKMTNELVHSLIEKGFRADEIAQLIQCTSDSDRASLFHRTQAGSDSSYYSNRPTPPVKQPV